MLSPGSADLACGLTHSSSTGDLYTGSMSAGTSPLFDEVLSPESDNDMEMDLLRQHVQKCSDSLVVLKSIISSDISPGNVF